MSKDNSELVSTLVASLSSEEKVSLLSSLMATKGGKKGASKPKLEAVDVLFVEGTFTDTEAAVTACISQHAYIPWSRAYATCFSGNFQSARIGEVVAAFEAVEAGASAVIVDAKGYHGSKVSAQHKAWLEAAGYEQFPGSK